MRSSARFVATTSAVLWLATVGTAEAECKSGFVWRDARDGDGVCVTTEDRDIAKRQNANGPNNRTAAGGNTCRYGYVWREAWVGDTVCVTPPERAKAKEQNAMNAQRSMPVAATQPPPPPPPAPARNNSACQSYARSALKDVNEGIGRQECVRKVKADIPGRWNDDFNHHYDWCVTAPIAARNSESSIRDRLLLDCHARSKL